MLHSTSVKLRFAISVGANILRALISFATGILIARALNPVGYGELMFLMGSFIAIRSLLDLGSSSAFFTFLSKRSRGVRFYLAYFLWLTLQFGATLLMLWLVLPSGLFVKIWLGHERGIVMLAFAAVFMQQQLWQTVTQIGEAMRKTVKVQLMNLTVALTYVTVVLLLLTFWSLSVQRVLIILIMLYSIATVLAYQFLKRDIEVPAEPERSAREIFQDYWDYCKPMLFLALVGFAYDFSNKWMLQRFGGSAQQGYFQIASQFAAVSLLATTSILNVFWKEIAHAWEAQDLVKVANLYQRVSRGLVMLGAIISGLLLPWSEQIVTITLGMAYSQAWPVLAIMLLYPIYQSMGQIGGTMLLASGQTRNYMRVSVFTMLVSIPLTYFILAPTSGGLLPGLDMGAIGMAGLMVVLGILSVNVQAWVIARYGGWKFDWAFQVVGIPLMIAVGGVAKWLAVALWPIEAINVSGLIVPVTIAGSIYLCMVAVAIWWLPWLIGTNRGEIGSVLRRALGNSA